MIRSRSLAPDRRGNAALEFAMAAPCVLILLIGLLDIGRLFADQYALDQGVAVAARYAVVNSTSANVFATSQTAFDQQVQPLLGNCRAASTCTFNLAPTWTPSATITAMPAQTLNSATTLTVQN
jgi:Flp pilus assembly protein TadG